LLLYVAFGLARSCSCGSWMVVAVFRREAKVQFQ